MTGALKPGTLDHSATLPPGIAGIETVSILQVLNMVLNVLVQELSGHLKAVTGEDAVCM